MKCVECEKAGERSVIHFTSSQQQGVLDAFYDEDGKLHAHNPSTMTTFFKCSRGHSWSTIQGTTCGNCDYKSAP